MSPLTSNLGYPRIGEDRELKFALEGYWSGRRSPKELEAVANNIRQRNWQIQKDAGIDLIPSNDFSLYDHVLDTSCLVGAVPERFDHDDGPISLDTYLALARGRGGAQEICCATHEAVADVCALELRKWFDTNYHYLVPEFSKGQTFRLSSEKPFREFAEAREQNILTKPVLLGPVSYLLLGKCAGASFNRLELLDRLLPVYAEVLQRLSAAGADWIQLDEPGLVLDLSPQEREAFRRAYDVLGTEKKDSRLLLGTYFGGLGDNRDLALSLPCDALHIDAVEAQAEAMDTIEEISSANKNTTLSLGVVDGRNVWKNPLQHSLDLLRHAKRHLGTDRVIIAPSSSLLHVPHSVERERKIDGTVRSWLAFAREKLQELITLRDALDESAEAIQACEDRRWELQDRLCHPITCDDEVFERVQALKQEGPIYRTDPEERKTIQAEALGLPPFPTTTIGSFPQTAAIRTARSRHQKGVLSDAEYDAFLKQEIADVIRTQEEIGLDVLVHGEAERNDMVQYFAERLNGIACTEHGWVQSFGSRYVRPPIIYGDVSRPAPITVEWSRYAQSLTDKPVKGMLTGPGTILNWSFVRDDEVWSKSDVCTQIALAIRDEVRDLEAAGIRIIQIDEPALREGLPLRKDEQETYITWATAAFRTTISETKAATQIHTHTCYGDVRDILPFLRHLDVDVISVEAARSRLAFLEALNAGDLPCDIGPGIWDIHSPHVPSIEEMLQLIWKARAFLPEGKLWLNPDCGLKTRTPEQVRTSLEHLVEAAHITRSSVAPDV